MPSSKMHGVLFFLIASGCGASTGGSADALPAIDSVTDATVDAPPGPKTTITAIVAGLPTTPGALVGLKAMVQDGDAPWREVPLGPSITFDVASAYYGVGFGCQGNAFAKRETSVVYRAVAEGDRVNVAVPFNCSKASETTVQLTGQIENADDGLSQGTPYGIRSELLGRKLILDDVPSGLLTVPMSFRVVPGNGTLAIVRTLATGVDKVQLGRGVDGTVARNDLYTNFFFSGVALAPATQPFPAVGPNEFRKISVHYSTGPTDAERILLDEVAVGNSAAVSRRVAFVAASARLAGDFHTVTLTTLLNGQFISVSQETATGGVINFSTSTPQPAETAQRTAGISLIAGMWSQQSDADEYRATLEQTDDTGGCTGDACQVELKGFASPAYVAATSSRWRSPDVSQIPQFPAKFHPTKPIVINIGAGNSNGLAQGSGRITRFRGMQRTL